MQNQLAETQRQLTARKADLKQEQKKYMRSSCIGPKAS
jgi:hypothetical protein